MNWTGGRLRRHSSNNKAAALTKIQKQNFAKSKVKSSKDIYHQLPFQNFTQFRHFSKGTFPDDQVTNKVDGEAAHKSTQQSAPTSISYQQPSFHSNTRHPSQKASRLGRIKRQLLDKSDWAVVSASRPLQMTFTPIEELERFGKRRRLTEADKKRLTNYYGSLQAPELIMGRARRRDDTPSQAANDDVDIRINGIRAGESPARRNGNITSNYTSSQPMLLDRNSTSPENYPRTQEPYTWDDRKPTTKPSLLLSTSSKLSSSRLASMQSRSTPDELPILNTRQHNTQILTDSHILQHSPHIIQDSTQMSFDSFIPQQEDFPESHSPSNSPNHTPQQDPPIRRFTIDDQYLAEQEGLLNISPTTIPETKNMHTHTVSPTELLQPRSPTLSISSNQRSPWLPQPKCSIQRFTGRRNNALGTFFTGKIFNQNGFQDFETEQRLNSTEQIKSPMTIYGQSIILGEDGSVDQIEESVHAMWRI
ncbi:hypothetical protein PHISCL_06537 [Aspergillus sclerotialis]|uniref:Uncharacterized protein n=1 Tax=Aspergillus sclerotialis TaxID=2070753 RepID=A0A3A2ZDA9_9EURO|nr:hypothetical protein PHISCL_06537 [Aspergillus sclerotialis]